MARKPRLHAPGSFRHLVDRGNRHQDIFEKPGDYVAFLAAFLKAAREGGMAPLALCLMPNHWHALVREGETPLGEILQPVLGRFALVSNRRNGRSGHLFEGRFKDDLIETTEGAKEVLRYIHRNPLRAKLVENADDWPWSSHGEYAGTKPESTVSTGILLSAFSEDPPTARRLYVEFMAQAVPEGVRPDMLPTLNGTAKRVEGEAGLPPGTLRGARRDPAAVKERHRFIRLVAKAGVKSQDIAAYLGISRSSVYFAIRT